MFRKFSKNHLFLNQSLKISTYSEYLFEIIVTCSHKSDWLFLQLPVAKEPTEDSAFIEKWAWYVREMVNYKEKPSGLDVYFDQLFEASDRNNIEKGKLSIYDKMVRDEIGITSVLIAMCFRPDLVFVELQSNGERNLSP